MAYSRDDLKRIGGRWIDRINAAEKREKDWIDAAEEAEAAYLCDEKSEKRLPDFNILHSNVETIVPAIFNSSPVPEIRARYGRAEDAVAKVVADILERAIEVQSDDNRVDEEIEASAQDAFMAGRGIVRVKFDADFETVSATEGMAEEEVPTNERVIYEVVSWRDYREGPAKRWKFVPWVAYRHEVSEAERKRLEDPEIKKAYADEYPNPEEDLDCTIWEIWCKESKRVYFVIEESATVIKVVDDPLGLQGFFPQPKPVQPITATGKRTPVCPYTVYKKLAGELDTITRRINAIMQGLKVRGLGVGAIEELQALADADDNEIVAAQNLEGLAATRGLENAILWWPIETAIAVLQQLYVQRDSTRQSIFEITGISDIVRGQSDAKETLGAQEIKTQWGSLRIKKMQRLVERLARDLFVLTVEIIGSKFTPETIQKQTGMQVDEQIMALLQDSLGSYRIDVESDSTVRADLTRNRAEMSEFLNGTAQFFSTMAPIVQQAPEAAGPLAKMYAAFARQFNLGKSAEDALDQFTQLAERAASQPRGNPEAEAAQAELQIKAKELEIKMQEMALRTQESQQGQQTDSQIKAAELQLKGQESQTRAQIDAAKLQLDAEKLQLEREKLDIERGRLGVEARKADHEVNVKMAEVSARHAEVNTKDMGMAQDRFNEAMQGVVTPIIEEIRSGNAELAKGFQAQMQALADAISQGNRQMIGAMTAPREIERDPKTGRPTGRARILWEPEAVN